MQAPLVDRFGRLHDNLRISVTDRCNIRCFYCMPEEGGQYAPKQEILSFEEMARFTRIAVKLGIRKVRITGGEPLARKDLHKLIAQLNEIEGIEDIALTTNAVLLGRKSGVFMMPAYAGSTFIWIRSTGSGSSTSHDATSCRGCLRVLISPNRWGLVPSS